MFGYYFLDIKKEESEDSSMEEFCTTRLFFFLYYPLIVVIFLIFKNYLQSESFVLLYLFNYDNIIYNKKLRNKHLFRKNFTVRYVRTQVNRLFPWRKTSIESIFS